MWICQRFKEIVKNASKEELDYMIETMEKWLEENKP